MWCGSFKKDNFKKKFVALEKCLNVWSSRDLTPFVKITIIKSLALSNIIFTSSLLSVLTGFVDQVNKSVSNFIWNHKPPKIKRSTMIGRIKDGGLSMPDFDIIGKSLKAGWVKRLLGPQAQSWKTTPFSILHSVGGHMRKCNHACSLLRSWQIASPTWQRAIWHVYSIRIRRIRSPAYNGSVRSQEWKLYRELFFPNKLEHE